VFGPRQLRSTIQVWGAQSSGTFMLVPGSGGGAKLGKLAGYGSRAVGFNPDGCVYIRLTKIV
jgi:hypothetical protein